MKSRHSYLETKSKLLVAFYDSFREGLISNYLMDKSAVKAGQFSSLPEFCLIDVGTKKFDTIQDVVLLQDFNLSVVMDVYEITETFLEELNEYYGYFHNGYDLNRHNRTKIQTPYGEAYLYVNNQVIKEGKIIPSGDLVDYLDYAEAGIIPTHKFKELQK